MVRKWLIFSYLSYIELSTEFDKTGIIGCLYASPIKTCQVFIQKLFHINNILQNTHAPILQKNYHVDTGGSIMNRCNKLITGLVQQSSNYLLSTIDYRLNSPSPIVYGYKHISIEASNVSLGYVCKTW